MALRMLFGLVGVLPNDPLEPEAAAGLFGFESTSRFGFE